MQMHFLCIVFIFLTVPYIASVLTWYKCDNTEPLHQKASKDGQDTHHTLSATGSSNDWS